MPGQKYDPYSGTLSDIADEAEESATTITLDETCLPYHAYRVQEHELWEREPAYLSARGLLDIAAYVAENQERLEQEASSDDERNQRAISADMADMYAISRNGTPIAPMATRHHME